MALQQFLFLTSLLSAHWHPVRSCSSLLPGWFIIWELPACKLQLDRFWRGDIRPCLPLGSRLGSITLGPTVSSVSASASQVPFLKGVIASVQGSALPWSIPAISLCGWSFKEHKLKSKHHKSLLEKKWTWLFGSWDTISTPALYGTEQEQEIRVKVSIPAFIAKHNPVQLKCLTLASDLLLQKAQEWN